jgi:uncharacterized delta-60 repeat protein
MNQHFTIIIFVNFWLTISKYLLITLFIASGTLNIFSQAAGTLDYDFGGDGIVTIDIGTATNDLGYQTLVQPDGKVLIAGRSDDNLILVRLLPDGALDNSFGINGVLTYNNPSIYNYWVLKLFVKEDGKILVIWRPTYSGNNKKFAVIQLHANGFIDGSFGDSGVKIIDISGLGYSEEPKDAAFMESEGKIVIIGRFNSDEGTKGAMVRLNPNGTLDPSFSFDGKLVTEFFTSPSALILQENGKLLVISGSHLARFNVDGTIDYGFGDSGEVNLDFDGYFAEKQSDDKIVLVGESNDNVIALARIHPDGLLDTEFGDGGYVQYVMPYSISIEDVALQEDDRIVIIGENKDDDDLFVARFDPDGFIDASFSNGGFAQMGIGNSYTESAESVSIQMVDNKIVLAGYYWSDAETILVARFHGGALLPPVVATTDVYHLPVSIYPNPVRDELNIELPKGRFEVEVFDLQGRLVFSIGEEQSSFVTLDLHFLSPGIYGLKVTGREGSYVEKFVKVE